MWKRLSVAGPQTMNKSASEMGESVVTDTTNTSKTRQSNAGTSLAGLMLSRRFAKRLSTKVNEKRGTIGSSSAGLLQDKEPTYRMEPTNRFNACTVEKVIKSVLEGRLETFKYNPKFCANITKILSDEIKDQVKQLGFDRYKFVCVVVLGQRSEQALLVSSRCTWDKKNDSYASYAFKNKDIVCTATVYGIYRE